MDRYFSCSGEHDANDDDDDDSSDDDDGGCDDDESEEEKEEMTRRHVGQFPVEFGELDRVVGRHFETRDADSGDSSGDGSSGDGSSGDGSSGDISGDGGGRGEGGGSGGSDGAENMTASSAPRRGCLAGFVIAGARGERRLQRTCVRELVLCGRAHDARLLGGLVSSSGGADSVAARDGLLAIAGLAPEANASKFLLGRLGIAPTLGIAVLRLFGDDSSKVAAAAQCVPPPASLPHSRSATCRSCAILMCNERVTLLSAYEHLSQRCPPSPTLRPSLVPNLPTSARSDRSSRYFAQRGELRKVEPLTLAIALARRDGRAGQIATLLAHALLLPTEAVVACDCLSRVAMARSNHRGAAEHRRRAAAQAGGACGCGVCLYIRL